MSSDQDRYQISETLGAGATSRVDKARDTLIGRVVALKTLRYGLGSADIEKQFLREAQIVGSLAHPHIVSLYDVGFAANGMPCLVMEYVEGKTLEQALQGGPVSLKKAAVWAADLATALGQAHQAGIIHGDVKPANVLITNEGKVKLGDFGVARFATQASASGNVMGTPAYLSPEQILGQTQDTRSDLFSLGIVLYEMATGVRPFQGDSVLEIGGQILSFVPLPPSHHNPELPPEFDHVVMRCLSKDPVDRYGTAEALSASLYPFARSATAKSKNETKRSIWGVIDTGRNLRTSVTRHFDCAATQITALCTRAVHRRDSKMAALAIFIAVLLFPICRAVLSHSQMQLVKENVASPVVWSADVDRIPSPASVGAVNVAHESVINLAEMNPNTVSEPVKAHAVYPSDEADLRLTVKHSVIHKALPPKSFTPKSTRAELEASNSPVARSDEPLTSEPLERREEATAAQETVLNVAIVSAVGEGAVAVFLGNRQLLITPLEPEHVGDTMRYNCPIEAGEHSIRVVLYRGNQTVLMEKQNGSDLRVGTSNSMQVHISRRSKLFVKHETALEVSWPTNTVAPVSAANSDYAR